MTVSATNSTTAANAALTGAGATSTANSTSPDPSIGDRFLTLLVTQLKNQDPLNPMDNSQMTSQLAQISTVTGINKLNDTMSGLAAALGSNQYVQAAGLVGHSVLVPGNKLALADGAGSGGFTLGSDADSVTVKITDAAGSTVRTIDLGALTAGTQTFAWNGTTDAGAAAKDGTYTFTVTAKANNASVTADPLMSGHVNGIVVGSNGTTQVQLGQFGRVDLSSVVEIN